MFKIFRKLRLKSISAVNTRKYILYAIGEIFLVVIGIVLALQLNIWNEERKNKVVETKYLENIKDDLEAHIKFNNSIVIERYERKLKGLRQTKSFIQNNFKIKDTLSFLLDASYGAVYSNGMSYLSSAVFEELKSTGGLQIIRNEELKSRIFNYYNFIEVQVRNLEYFNVDYQEFINSLRVFNKNEPSNIPKSDWIFMLSELGKASTLKKVNRELTYAEKMFNTVSNVSQEAKLVIELIDKEVQ